VLADHAAKCLEPELQIVADAGQLPGIEPAGLQQPEDLLQIALDGSDVEAVGDAAREVADLQEVHEALQPDGAPAGADGHLHLRPLPAQQQLRELVELQALVGDELVEEILKMGVLGPQRLPETFAQRLEIEEVQVEEPVEGRAVAPFLDERGGQGGPERLAIPEPDFGGGGQRVDRLRGRDTDLGPAEVADELEDPLVHA